MLILRYFFYVNKTKFRNRFIKQRYIVKKFISVCLQITKNKAINFQAFLLANNWKFKIKLYETISKLIISTKPCAGFDRL